MPVASSANGALAGIQPAIGSGVPGTQFLKGSSSGWAQSKVRENVMKSIVSILAVAIAIAFTAPAFAGPGSTITNKADCEKAGKVWDDAGKKCVEKQ